MAARDQSRAGMVPVHADEGAVQFQYTLVDAFGSSGRPASAQKHTPAAAAATPGSAARVELPSERGDGGAEPDFIALDVTPPAPQAAAGSGRPRQEGIPESETPEFISLEGYAVAKSIGAAAPAAARPELLAAVPWAAAIKGIRSPSLRLHQEIVEFCRFLAPSAEEAAARQAAIDRVAAVVKTIWPAASVEVFGSFATGLYLPTSDLDAVVMASGCGDIPAGLKALATALGRRSMVKNMQVISKARVPIIKFEEAESGYNFDVSFDVANGPEAAGNVRALMDSLPPMRPLVMVLKVFLQQRELNEVYSGGLGSYALLVLVAAFLQLHPSRMAGVAGARRYGGASASGGSAPAAALEPNLGTLLLDCLRLYGRALNNTAVGVSCRKGGSFFSKRVKGFHQMERPYLLAVEDPNDALNDLGRNSYNISRVRMAFDYAYCQLIAPAPPGESLLARVVRLDPLLFARAPPPHPPDPTRAEARGRGEEGGSRRRRRDEEGEEEEEEEHRRSKKARKKEKKEAQRRHRERSMSSDDGGRRSPSSDGRSSDGEGAGRRRPRDRHHHKHQHKRHHKHHHGGSGKQHHGQRDSSAEGRGGDRWQPRSAGGSGGRQQQQRQQQRRHDQQRGRPGQHIRFE